MKLKTILIATLLFFLSGIYQLSFSITPDIIVATDGTGNFTKIQDAINAVPSNQTDRRTIIFIKSGLYNTEKLIVPTDKQNVTIIGESRDQTIISYHIYDCSSPESGNKCPAEDAILWTGDNIRTSATLTIMGEGFRAENITIRNTAGPVGQALAITVQADKTTFINCDILGYQDTIYLWTAGKRSYFEGCLVLGRTDYIYGAGIGFFESCEIRSYGGGWITAPSTPQTQKYGYVFNNCDVTYATGSPRNGDDGALVRFGRPWHEYPKVTWLNCNMTEMIHPEGWGDTWNMDYAATSTDLHLYEYNNTGAGADMSGRANWAGIKALNETEAAEYTPAKVLNGTDGWAPYEEPPLVATYNWDGGGSNADWLTSENWDPDGIPASSEVANVIGNISIEANGGTFAADINLKEGATLNVISNSTVAYLICEKATISASTDVTLNGKIATKDTITMSVSANLTIAGEIYGIHNIIKTDTGTVILTNNNTNYSGIFTVVEGTINASTAGSLGNADVDVKSGASLIVNNDAAFFPESSLKVVNGAILNLNSTVTLSEFYINNDLQTVGTYNATTNPELITGTGSIIVGRPSSFTFSGGTWDNIASYTPALLPETGETVYCEGEMETSSTINQANIIFVASKGKLRLRGTHTSTGTLTFNAGSRISYATSGDGFTLNAPIVFNADINLEMNGGTNSGSSSMTLTGTITGSSKIIAKNTKSGMATKGTVWLNGDNSNFNGVWDITTHATDAGGTVGITGASANAFGTGLITVGSDNFVQFDHAESVSSNNSVILSTGSKAIVNTNISIGSLTLGGIKYTNGTFTATSHPDYIDGIGTITILSTGINNLQQPEFNVIYKNGILNFNTAITTLEITSINGSKIMTKNIDSKSININLPNGIYLITTNKHQATKLIIN
ncbi:MAG: hypothetical protein JW717_01210 [Marinilabiliaceae bacterium]|nr:hypothetical protein [Marinilabiliaceae bacterium]